MTAGSRRARRVRTDEWPAARELRLAALRDEAAPIAFLESYESAVRRSDGYWRTRTVSAATSDVVAQFIVEGGIEGGLDSASDSGVRSESAWAGSATVLVHPAGSRDYYGRFRLTPAAVVVAVYVRPTARASGVVDALLEAAASFAAQHGFHEITLDVHEDNVRAQSAYRRCGFDPTGESSVGPNGRELQFRRSVTQERLASGDIAR